MQMSARKRAGHGSNPPLHIASTFRLGELAQNDSTPKNNMQSTSKSNSDICSSTSPNPHIHSFVVGDFLDSHTRLAKHAGNICKDLLSNPSHHPSDPGPGACLSVEAPYIPRNAELNMKRQAHLRQHFRKDKSGLVFPSNSSTVLRSTYRSGCGSVTHGAPKWYVSTVHGHCEHFILCLLPFHLDTVN